MGSTCSCLNNMTSGFSEDLSQRGNTRITTNYINNNPKIDITNNSLSYKFDSKISQMNSNIDKNNNSNLLNLSKNKKIRKINKLNSNEVNKINKNNNNNMKLNNYNKENNSKIIENIKFEEFFNSKKGKEMEKQINNNASYQICFKLHKYFVKLLKKKLYSKNIKKYKQKGDKLFENYERLIYEKNKILSKSEQSCKIKYKKDGYKQFYPNISLIEEENMIYIPNKSTIIDNTIIIIYINEEEKSRNKEDILGISWIYKGQADINNLPNGYGVKYTQNGNKKEGYWKDGQLTGWSQSIDSEGNILMGPFIYGAITGKGIKYSFINNIFYKGDIVDNKKEGKGEELSNEGKFIGNFSNDKKNGEGKMIYSLSGDTYEGNYKDDLFNGEGHYIYKMSGQEYKGEYLNGLMHGKGLYEWSEGEYYKGYFVKGKKEGEGEMHWADGRSFIGPFVNGRPEGIGIFDNGINYKGEMEFIDGKLNRNYLIKKCEGSEYNSLQNSIDKNESYL